MVARTLSVVSMTYTDVMTHDGCWISRSRPRWPPRSDALNDRLAAEAQCRRRRRRGGAAGGGRVRATPLERWTAADPYLALLVHRAVLDARAAVEEEARDALRIALERLSHALAALGEAEEVGDARTPKELARWLVAAVEVPQRDLAALLGVDLRRFQRWISARERTQPEGEEARRLRALARLVGQLRHAFTPAGVRRVVRLAAARAGRRDPARAARRPGPAARAAARGGLDPEHGVRVRGGARVTALPARRPGGGRCGPSRAASPGASTA